MSSSDQTPLFHRAPRQARGRERRDSILDAAAAVIAEAGLDALSMHAVAQRAGASIGSMYHFFRDRDALLQALAQRHTDELSPVFAENLQRPDAEWAALPSSAVVDRLIGWAIRHFTQHPDALVIFSKDDKSKGDEYRDLLARVMRIRVGADLAPAAAATFFAVSIGTLEVSLTLDVISRDQVIADLPNVLTSYFMSLEARRKPG